MIRMPSGSRAGICRCLLAWSRMTLAVAGMLLAARLFAQPVAAPPADITRPGDFWTLSDEEKQQVHRVRLELTAYYCDPIWNLL